MPEGYTLHYFGWCSNPEKNSDKLWGFASVYGKVYNFWGKRGGKMQFKRWVSPGAWADVETACRAKAREKTNKGYRELTPQEVEEIWPNFLDDFRELLFQARVKGDVANEVY